MAHVIQNLLILFEIFSRVNFLGPETAVQPLVSLVLEDRIVKWLDNPSVMGC